MNNNKSRYMVSLVIIIISVLSLTLLGSAKDLTGEEILQLVEGGGALTGSGSATIELVTINKKGQEKNQSLKIYRIEGIKEDKQLVEFLYPADVKGTKFLIFNNHDKNTDEMWLYLPALKRERRIAAHMTKDNFMGTDFTYEEISGNYQGKYTANRLVDEKINAYDCYVLELHPNDQSDKTITKMWIWKDKYLPIKIEFFNKDKKLEKIMLSEEIKKQSNSIDESYLPMKITMENKLLMTKTVIKILEYSNEVPNDEYFTMQYLRR